MTTTFRDIKTDLLRKITRGAWKPGSLIPSELELADHYGVARATVNRAMRELADEGIIERKRKSGSRVRLSPLRQARFEIPVARREIEERGSPYRYVLLHSGIITAPQWLRARLKLQDGQLVRHVLCLHLAENQPYQLEDRWINLELLPQAREADFSTVGPNEWLISQIPFSEVEYSISATAADAAQAQHLKCALGDPLLQVERATRWQGRSVTFVRLVHASGHRMTTRY